MPRKRNQETTTTKHMAGSNILEERMLQDTLGLFRDGNLKAVSPGQGVMLIDGWLQALQGDTNLGSLETNLTDLRTELQAHQPNQERVSALLTILADETQRIAEGPNAEGTWTGGLESLSKFLRDLANQS